MCDLTGKLCSSGTFEQCMKYNQASSSGIQPLGCQGVTMFTVCASELLSSYFKFWLVGSTDNNHPVTVGKLCDKAVFSKRIIIFLFLQFFFFFSFLLWKIFFYVLALLTFCSLYSREFFIKCPLSPSSVLGTVLDLFRNKFLIINLGVLEISLCYSGLYVIADWWGGKKGLLWCSVGEVVHTVLDSGNSLCKPQEALCQLIIFVSEKEAMTNLYAERLLVVLKVTWKFWWIWPL